MLTDSTLGAAAPKLGEHAIVVGAGIAGLLCARVLAPRFERVTLLERDALGPSPGPRKSTPQDRHANVLNGAGACALSRWFPSLACELERRGATPFDAGGGVRHEWLDVHWPALDLGLPIHSVTRPVLEACLRNQLVQAHGVVIRSEARVTSLLWRRSRVVGVRACLSRGTVIELAADWVIDAGGSAGLICSWLADAGYAQPELSCVRSSTAHTSRMFAAPAGASSEPKLLHVHPQAPDVPRAGSLIPVEGSRWLVRLSAWGHAAPPGDLDGFSAFARSLVQPTLWEALHSAEALGPAFSHAFFVSVRRHFEQLPRFPEGLLAIGDSLCTFNPFYAQGCSVAALQAAALEQLLSRRTPGEAGGLSGLWRDYFRCCAELIDSPWRWMLLWDLAFPSTDATGPKDWKASRRQLDALRIAAAQHPPLLQRMLEVMHLLRPLPELFDPELEAYVPPSVLTGV